jgi:chromosome segregation ATPase
MSDANTAEVDGSRAFQERVFTRFDAVDNRLDAMDTRIEELEMKQYDTRPIWEQALAAILEVKTEVGDLRMELGGVRTEVGDLRHEMSAGFTSARHDLEHEARKIGRRIDALAESWLELKADQRYLDRRLAELEERSGGN